MPKGRLNASWNLVFIFKNVQDLKKKDLKCIEKCNYV